MKNKNKIFTLIILIILFIFLYILGAIFIKNKNINIHPKIHSFIPTTVKNFIRNKIFFIPNLEATINDLNNDIRIQKETIKRKNEIIKRKNEIIKEIPDKFLEGYYPLISYKMTEKNRIIKTKYSNYLLTKFETGYLFNGKGGDDSAASAYIEEYNDKIFIVTGDGRFSYFYKQNLNSNNFDSIPIPTNIKEIIKYSDFYDQSSYGIKDILIDENKLYVSYSNQLFKDCFNTAILVADINLEYLKLNKFFIPKNCIKEENDYGRFNAHIAGGRIVDFKDNKLLFSTGAFQYSLHAQNKNNLFGKILSIDKINGDWKIVSMGHRNIQGLKYNYENDIIFSTEHGPIGGDELNININPDINDVKNYGWPISSYGVRYKQTEIEKENTPLYKSHKKYGFVEPVKYYVPSIGISEIEKIPIKFNKEFDNDFFIASMGNNQKEGDLSIHHIKIDKDFKKILKEDIIPIGERIRDLKYIESLNKIILFIENSPGIAVLHSN